MRALDEPQRERPRARKQGRAHRRAARARRQQRRAHAALARRWPRVVRAARRRARDHRHDGHVSRRRRPTRCARRTTTCAICSTRRTRSSRRRARRRTTSCARGPDSPARRRPGGATIRQRVARARDRSTAPGLISITGGKLTTYRVMAADVMDSSRGACERDIAARPRTSNGSQAATSRSMEDEEATWPRDDRCAGHRRASRCTRTARAGASSGSWRV